MQTNMDLAEINAANYARDLQQTSQIPALADIPHADLVNFIRSSAAEYHSEHEVAREGNRARWQWGVLIGMGLGVLAKILVPPLGLLPLAGVVVATAFGFKIFFHARKKHAIDAMFRGRGLAPERLKSIR